MTTSLQTQSAFSTHTPVPQIYTIVGVDQQTDGEPPELDDVAAVLLRREKDKARRARLEAGQERARAWRATAVGTFAVGLGAIGALGFFYLG